MCFPQCQKVGGTKAGEKLSADNGCLLLKKHWLCCSYYQVLGARVASHMEVISISAKLPCKLFWATIIKNTLHMHLYKLKSWKNMSVPQKSKCFLWGCLQGTVIIKQPGSLRNAEISEPVWLPTAVQTVQRRIQIDLGHVLRVPDNQVLKKVPFQHEEERRESNPEEGQEIQ